MSPLPPWISDSRSEGGSFLRPMREDSSPLVMPPPPPPPAVEPGWWLPALEPPPSCADMAAIMGELGAPSTDCSDSHELRPLPPLPSSVDTSTATSSRSTPRRRSTTGWLSRPSTRCSSRSTACSCSADRVVPLVRYTPSSTWSCSKSRLEGARCVELDVVFWLALLLLPGRGPARHAMARDATGGERGDTTMSRPGRLGCVM
mmetsp:Transcript_7808/g.19426  ORF Transcript_7808/g.19426 Transcript_7808/m.19426 type:complete len:203 (-) Transcript_7808:1844-2452(-)